MLLGGAVLAACSSSSSSPTTTTTHTTLHVLKVQPVAAPITATTITINGTTVAVPRQEYTPDRPIDPRTDNGQQIIIATDGVLPQTLDAPFGATFTWTNLTPKTVSVYVVFAGAASNSGPIAPGGHYSLPTSRAASGTFLTSTGLSGTIEAGLLPMAPIPTTTTTTTAAG
jgi:hypothetical protein